MDAALQETLLTFAELEAMLADEPRWPAVRAAMSTEPPADDMVAAAGRASLFVRDMAELDDYGATRVTEPAQGLARRLGTAATVIGLTLAQPDNRLVPLLLCADKTCANRVLARVAGPGVVALSEPGDDDGLPVQVSQLVEGLLAQSDGSVWVKPQGRPALTLTRTGQRWQWCAQSDDGEFHATTLDQARGLLQSFIAASTQ